MVRSIRFIRVVRCVRTSVDSPETMEEDCTCMVRSCKGNMRSRSNRVSGGARGRRGSRGSKG